MKQSFIQFFLIYSSKRFRKIFFEKIKFCCDQQNIIFVFNLRTKKIQPINQFVFTYYFIQFFWAIKKNQINAFITEEKRMSSLNKIFLVLLFYFFWLFHFTWYSSCPIYNFFLLVLFKISVGQDVQFLKIFSSLNSRSLYILHNTNLK